MSETFIDELESIVDEVSTWMAEQVTRVTKALAPDGRPFGSDKVDIEQQLDEYRRIRNSPELWTAWINAKSGEIQNELTTSGVDIEAIGVINPQQLAISYAQVYSQRMEKELNKRMI